MESKKDKCCMTRSMSVICLLALLCASIPTQAQVDRDSLWSVWQDTGKPDTTRGQALQHLAWDGYIYSRPDSAYYFAKVLLDFAEAKGLKKLIAEAVIIQGVSFGNRGDYPRALDHYQRSLRIQRSIGYIKGMANSVNNIGDIYCRQGKYNTALGYFARSLGLFESIGDQEGTALAQYNMGWAYQRMGNTGEAMAHYQRSLVISRQIGDKGQLASATSGIGMVYKEMGNGPLALDHLSRALALQEVIGDKQGAASSLTEIGTIHRDQQAYSKALFDCHKALDMARVLGDVDAEKLACTCLYQTYKAMGNGTEALVYHEFMSVLSDSLKAEETGRLLQNMEFAAQLQVDSLKQVELDHQVEQTHRTEVQQKVRTRNIAVGSSLFLLLVAGSVIGRNRYIRRAKRTLQTEKDRSDDLLLNILPAAIAEELKNTGGAIARHVEGVSVLFTDFKGFTQLSEQLTAQELVGELNTCFKAFDHIITARGIEKIKTIGDAYMCAGGLPDPRSSSAADVVHAALEMQAFMIGRQAQRRAQSLPAFEMRVGVHTGPVVAGIVGVKKFQYDIWGDTVNIASRMESSGEVGMVNISEATHALLINESGLQFTSRGKVQAKGKGELMMYYVHQGG